MRMIRNLLVGLAALAVLVFVGLEVVQLVAMGPSMYWGLLRYDQRSEGDLEVGDKAPDVAVTALDGSRVRLADRFGARPVVLVFGSYT